MPSLPEGDAWPVDGRLDPARVGPVHRHLSLYVHVPFCTVRCGYCDFNTYTVGFGSGADTQTYHQSLEREIDLAATVLADFPARPLHSIFFGGGTPTLLQPAQLRATMDAIGRRFVFDHGCEVTIEANPDTVDNAVLAQLREAGFTRVSFGMQSADRHVLRTLDRTHDPDRIGYVVEAGRRAGLDVSVDLIYGTPGETMGQWRDSLEVAVATAPDHISTYALVVEPGTAMGAAVARGKLPLPDEDEQAQKYQLADALLPAAGFEWYEISNWARLEASDQPPTTRLRHASRHNLAYWADADWWGIGPGAHSHLGTARWWNRKHPRAWLQALQAGQSPAQAGEWLSASERELEFVMLAIRTADGIALADLPRRGRAEVPRLAAEGLVEHGGDKRVRLTLRGRLMADLVTRRLTD